ncbi:peroxiredoxin [Paenibacillus elgii]
MLAIGTKAPAFAAESTQGTVRLADHLGKRPIVLIFYPKDNTPICTKQLCAVRDSKAQYADYDALMLGVNPGSLEEHRQFSQKFGYDFPLVTDSGETIRQLYDDVIRSAWAAAHRLCHRPGRHDPVCGKRKPSYR